MMCGAKCSGKTTTATAIYAYHLVQQGAIPNANIDDTGRMSIVFNKETNEGIYFDIDSMDSDFLQYKNSYTDAYINHVGFADELKRVSSNLFGLDFNKLIGTNDQKNELCHIEWENILKLVPQQKRAALKKKATNEKYMTNREFLEVFGTNICRVIYGDCHIQSAYKKLCSLAPDIGLITDCRFSNEFEFFEKIKDIEVVKIRLLRNVHKSTAESETGLDDISNDRFDLVVPEDLNLYKRNNMVIDFLVNKGVLSSSNIEAK